MEQIVSVLIILGIAIVIFLLIREIVMWYYKINERIELLKQNNALLQKILMKLPDDPLKSETTKIEEK